MRLRLLPLVVVMLGACAKQKPAVPPPSPELKAQTGRAASATAEDGPLLSLVPENTTTVDRGPKDLKIEAIDRDAAAVYVRAETDSDWEPELVRLDVTAAVYGLAAYDEDKDTLSVRFSGKDVPATFDVKWETLRANGSIAEKGVFHLTTPKSVKTAKSLHEEYFAGLASMFRSVTELVRGVDTFYAFAAQRAMLTSRNGKVPEYMEAFGLDEAMALYTGAQSLHDALQSDRALRIKHSNKRTMPIAQVVAAKIEPHPWDQLNHELGLQATSEPLASVVPAGMLYLHASSAKSLSATVDTLTDRLVGLVQASGVDSGTGDVVDRYATQLALEHSPAMAALADAAIDGIAIAASDPFFREGTDVTVAFHATNPSLLETGLTRKDRDISERYAATHTTYKIGAHDVTLTATADGKVHRHLLRIGDVILVSNSRAAIERFVAVQDAKAPSIASGGDFTYMRSLYPYDRRKEDAFVFIGDAFVAHVTSPAFKIGAARRVQALAETQALSYAAMLYAWLEGQAPDSTEALLKLKLVDKAELTHLEGESIAFDRYRGAYDRGAAVFAKPLLEQTIDKVTTDERDAYASFAQDYEQRWSKYIDPAALRITNGDKELTLDARMLPIVNRGDYADLESIAGPARVGAPDVRGGIAWTSAVGPDAALRHDLEGSGRSIFGRDFQLGWLGGWIMAGVSDHAGLYDMAIASGALGKPARDDDDEETHAFVPPLWRTVLQHAPFYIGAEIKNPVTFAALLATAKHMTEQAAPGLIDWGSEEPIDGQPVSVIREGATGAPEDQRIAIHYSTMNGIFLASFDRNTLIEQFAAIREGRGAKTTPSDKKGMPSSKPLSESAQSTLDYAPADGGWLMRIVAALAERVAHTAEVRSRFADDAVRPYLQGITDEPQRAATTTSLLGYTPFHTDVAATKNLTKVRHVGARLSIEGTGEHRGLHTSLTLGD